MKAERAEQQVSNKGKKGRGKLFRQAGAVFSACSAAKGAGGQKGGKIVLQSDKKVRVDFFELTDFS